MVASTRLLPPGARSEMAAVNGELAMIIRAGGQAFLVLSITAEDEQVREIRAVGNPDKLKWVNLDSGISTEVKE